MKRQVFAICDDKAAASVEGTELGHVEYMVQQGIMKSPKDSAYQRAVRGYVDKGKLYAFQGAMFTMPKRTNELVMRLRQIVDKLGVDRANPVQVATYTGSNRLVFVPWVIWTHDEIVTGKPDVGSPLVKFS